MNTLLRENAEENAAGFYFHLVRFCFMSVLWFPFPPILNCRLYEEEVPLLWASPPFHAKVSEMGMKGKRVIKAKQDWTGMLYNQ